MKNNKLYLSNIQECIQNIEIYTKDGEEIFKQNRMIQDAVIRNFEIIGEAVKRIEKEIKESQEGEALPPKETIRSCSCFCQLLKNVSKIIEHDNRFSF